MKKMKSVVKFLLPLIILSLIVGTAVTSTRAQDPNQDPPIYLPFLLRIDPPKWIGPEGGSVNVLITDPSNSSVLYAGTQGAGVFKTTNGGTSWVKANSGISTYTVNALAINLDDNDIIYAGVQGQQGVYKSTDGGSTWTAANKNIKANSNVLALAINPGNSALVYAATQTLNTTNGVLYKSSDSGATWTAVLTQTNNWINSLAVNPNKPYIILAASQNNGPYYATAYGNEGDWKKASISGGDWETGMWVGIDSEVGVSRAYFVSQTNDLYRSVDDGKTWVHEYGGPGTTVVSRNGLTINPFAREVLYMAASSSSTAGVLRTGDYGDSWQAAGLKGKKINTVVASRANSDTVFAGADQEGVFKSTNNGSSWTASSTGLGSSYVTGLVFSGPTTFYAGSYGGGIFKTTNAGGSWAGFNAGLSDRLINGLVQSPTNANLIYALTAGSGLYRNDLSGTAGWVAVGGLPAAFEQMNLAMRDDPATAAATAAVGTNALVFDPSNPNLAYLGTNGGGLYVSTNSAASFAYKNLDGQVVKSIAVSPTNSNILYIAAFVGTKDVVEMTNDGGTTWTTLPQLDTQQRTISSVAVWPDGTLTAGTSNGMWTYNGTSWTAAGLQGYTVKTLARNPASPEALLAGTNKGVFVSYNHVNWTQVAKSAGSIDVASISVNPAGTGMLFIGTVDRGTLWSPY